MTKYKTETGGGSGWENIPTHLDNPKDGQPENYKYSLLIVNRVKKLWIGCTVGKLTLLELADWWTTTNME
jgi:hypothetical protein